MATKQKSKITDEQFNSAVGNGTILLFIVAMIVFAFYSHFSFITLAKDVLAVYSGDFAVKALTLDETIRISIQLMLTTFVVAMICLYFMPKGKSINHFNLFKNGPQGVYLTIFLEEYFTRYLILGVLAKWLNFAFWPTMILMLIANTAWAALHLMNYDDPSERKPLAVLSQFVTGLLFFYIFMRYGFWITLLVHLSFDFMLFSADKVQTTIVENLANLVFWFAALGITLWVAHYFHIAIPSIAPWLNNVLIMPGGMWPMVIFMVIAFSVAGIAENLFGFDHVAVDREILKQSIPDVVFTKFWKYIVRVLIILALSWILSHWIEAAFTKAVIISMILIYLQQPKSGSAMANLWFTDMPITFLYVFVALTFPFWPAVLILTIPSLVNYIPSFIEAF